MMMRPIQVKGLSALVAATLLLVLLARQLPLTISPLSYAILVWSSFQSMIAFFFFTWSVQKSDRAFFSVFVSDALVRFLSLGVAVYLLHSWNQAYTVPLLTLALGYLVLSLVQIPFLHKMAA